MKKRIALFLALIIMMISLASCGGEKKEKVYVFNWGDYMDMEVIKQFEEETGIEVVYEEYATNEDMYFKIKNGGSNYDVIFPSDYMISKMIAEDMLEKIDLNNIKNYSNIGDEFKNLGYDPKNEYSVPYTWGTLGIIYNPEVVKEEEISWDILWDTKYKGEILIVDSVRDALVPAMVRNGFSINTKDIGELEIARDELIKQKELVNPIYVGDNGKAMMLQGEASIFLTWIGEAKQLMAQDDKFKYALPKNGGNKFFDAICIPKGSKNKENAEKFINFLTDAKIAAKNYEYVGYPIPNVEALKLLPEEVKSDKASYPEKEILNKCEVFLYLGDTDDDYNRVWTEIKAK